MPARSPMPLTVHSTCVAPAATPASVFATASPRSSWQWTESVTSVELRAEPAHLAQERRVLLGERVADGVGEVDRRRSRLDRARDDLRDEGGLGAGRVLAENSTSSTRPATYATAKRACSTTSAARARACAPCGSGSSRGRRGCACARAPRRAPRRPRRGPRARPRERRDRRAVDARRRRRGRPRSRRARRRRSPPRSRRRRGARARSAISPFSSGESAMPGDCSPSLSVVSKIVILRRSATFSLLLSGAPEDVPLLCFGRRLRRIRRVGRVSP